ncbi:putative PurR-regulated permease PerM [Arthrobacter bambusae]|uniref:PurR-regulated permease PerM n=2 Tax=Arthrobacter TaxID=1663 RepID=A0AAW8DGF0_9MICC|nr:putative PurR-regulated permease PerM [Arthrobacter bambusae]MDQ0129808.1 putative PurR-regulated permease PerM [Arthrobacter bambusae]MDQ0181188.1 putative PurR-regulated permease PerM [Arthrobacter bambusae]MDQ0241083.1 putative PurR-regulated permease PerM [Arthrobacter bambusae]
MKERKDPTPAEQGPGTSPGGLDDGSAQDGRDHGEGLMASFVRRLRQPIPGAQPRVRFEMPPELEHDATAEPALDESDGPRFGSPGPRMSAQHPLYVGFMGTAGVGVALMLYYIGTNTAQLLLWIVTALFIALGLDPVVRGLEERKVPRPAGVVIAVGVLVAGVAAFFATLIPTIVEQVSQIVRQAPDWIRGFVDSDFFRSLDSQFGVRDKISQELDKFVKNPDAMGGIFGGVVGFGSTVANGVFGTLIVLVLSLYFLGALPAMKRWGYRLAPRSRRPRVEALSEEITRSVGNYVIGQVCVALLNALFAFIVMSILGIPFSVLLAFVVALLAFIPLVGGLIAAVVVILVALTAGWQTAVIYAICYFAYLQFEAYFISPRIMQKAVAVPGAVAVISVIAGGSLLGVLGALIAIPTAAAIMLLIKEVFIVRQDRH